MSRYYPLREVYAGKAILQSVPYTEQGFSSYAKARHAMRNIDCTIIRGDRVVTVMQNYERRNN